METTLSILFGCLFIFLIGEFWIVMKHFDYMSEHFKELKDKLGALEALQSRQLIVLGALQDISDILVHGRTKEMEDILNKMEQDIEDFKNIRS